MNWMKLIAVIAFPVLLALSVMADEQERSQRLAREIRCVACENEPVSQSAAPIAEDMRERIDEMIAQGASDQEIRDWFATRYGEYALFRPSSSSPIGMILWATPFVLLACGAIIVYVLRATPKENS